MKLYTVDFPFSTSIGIRSGSKLIFHTYGFQSTDRRKAFGVARKVARMLENRVRLRVKVS